MNNSTDDNEFHKFSMVVYERSGSIEVKFVGDASLNGMLALQLTITRIISSNFGDNIPDDAVLLQGQIFNSSLRLAKMFGHDGECVISLE
jgi:hypothetical protein